MSARAAAAVAVAAVAVATAAAAAAVAAAVVDTAAVVARTLLAEAADTAVAAALLLAAAADTAAAAAVVVDTAAVVEAADTAAALLLAAEADTAAVHPQLARVLVARRITARAHAAQVAQVDATIQIAIVASRTTTSIESTSALKERPASAGFFFASIQETAFGSSFLAVESEHAAQPRQFHAADESLPKCLVSVGQRTRLFTNNAPVWVEEREFLKWTRLRCAADEICWRCLDAAG